MAKHQKESIFGGNREKAIKRDGYKCVKCGMTREEHKKNYNRDLTVDHIDGKGTYTPPEERNNNLDNLQTLCQHCHGFKDIQRCSTLAPRAVWQLTTEGKRIRLFSSIVEVQKEGIAKRSNVIRVCRGRLNETGGFKWEYSTESSLYNKNLRSKKYYCKHCLKVEKRKSDKKWIKSWCENTSQEVHLIPV